MTGPRVVVGLSGGVDSSVAAYLLKQQGYEVVGLFMKNWEDDDDDEYCSSRQDWLDAASVADLIGIDIEAVNFAAEYRERVFAAFLAEYSAGRTPNPDVLCNAEIKFRAFLDHALQLGAAHIATGHYARVRERHGRFELLRGIDPGKDQSYFLHRLNQAQLAKTLFPVGHLPKSEVRRIAREIGLPVAAKRDSTGICFIGERPFREFLNRYLPMKPGPIRTPEGKVVGEHVGLSFYTLGQRKGIGVGGTREGSGEPWFVARKDMASNTLWIVQGHDHPWLLADELVADDASWIGGEAPAAGARLTAKTRYRQADAPCAVAAVDRGRFTLQFDAPQWAATPGQSAVLYDGEVCLGGGVIDRVGVMAQMEVDAERLENRKAIGSDWRLSQAARQPGQD
jgi:tRNA-specific 2-thiouridylase